MVIKNLLTILLLSTFVTAQIAPKRAKQIQTALIKHGYKVRVNGVMDKTTTGALTSLQKDNGWQSRVVPDSRSLIVLGLGPDYSKLLNPDTAWLPSAKRGGRIYAKQIY